MPSLAFIACLMAGFVATAPAATPRGTSRPSAGVTSAVPMHSHALIKRVTIAGTRYTVINSFKAIRYVRSPYAKLFGYLLDACQAAGSWGFLGGGEAGIVAYVPTDPSACFPRGGPSGAPSPCAQFYRTRDGAYWVMIAGTSTDVCADMSTQVPGASRGHTTATSDSGVFGANEAVWVTCQEFDEDNGVLWDYIKPRASGVGRPTGTDADWIDDADVDTGYADWIPHLPRCSGVNTAF